jgi:hypothetical protein
MSCRMDFPRVIHDDSTVVFFMTPNAAVQPQIRAQREFVGWNCLLGPDVAESSRICSDICVKEVRKVVWISVEL